MGAERRWWVVPLGSLLEPPGVLRGGKAHRILRGGSLLGSIREHFQRVNVARVQECCCSHSSNQLQESNSQAVLPGDEQRVFQLRI